MSVSDFEHAPVMRDEIVDTFRSVPGGVVLDATLGGGGHAEAILDSRTDLRVLGLDRDPDALEAATARLDRFGDRVMTHRCRFDELDAAMSAHSVAALSGALFDLGLSLIDLALWLADYPPPRRVWAHVNRSLGQNAVEEMALVTLECANGMACTFDLSWSYVGDTDRWWFESISSRGSARLAPLRVVKELNGRPVDISPMGAAARESTFIQSYRAELAHFIAVLRGESAYELPSDQLTLHRILEAAYRSAEETCEVKL